MADELRIGSSAQKLAQLATDVDHSFGSPAAVVTLIEYADFQCEDSQAAFPVVKETLARSGNWLRIIFRHFPLDIHDNARLAAEAAEAAAAQDMFWEMHDMLFENQDKLDKDSILMYAEFLGLDIDEFMDDLNQHKFADKIDLDIDSGKASGVTKTPTIFVNDKMYTGSIEVNTLLNAIESAGEDLADE